MKEQLRISMRNSLIAAAIVTMTLSAWWSASAIATTIYEGPGVSVTISTPQPEDIWIKNGATLTMNPGAVVNGLAGWTENAVSSSGGSTLIGNGGVISGGSSGIDHGGDAFGQSDGSIANISGGTYTGGSTSANDFNAGSAIVQFGGLGGNNTILTISGGFFTGGNAVNRGGGDAVVSYGDILNISGGIFTGGNSIEMLGADALVIFDTLTTINGGTFVRGNGPTGDGVSIAAFDSTIDMYGGFFPDGILLFGTTTLNIFGSDLTYEGDLLEGLLANGNPVSISVQLYEDAAVVLHNKGPNAVPEPGTMLLLGSGLIGLAGYGRNKFLKRQ